MHSKKTILTLVCLLLSVSPLSSQDSELDSLMQVLPSAMGEERLDLLIDIVNLVKRKEPVKSLEMAAEALQLATDLESDSGLARIHRRMGDANRYLERHEEAINHYAESIKYRRIVGDSGGVSLAFDSMGRVYRHMGDFRKALQMSLQAVRLAEEFSSERTLSTRLNNLGVVYSSMGEYEKASECYLRSSQLREKNNDLEDLAETYSDLGETYEDQGNFEQAEVYYKKALALYRQNDDLVEMARSYRDLGDLCDEFEKYPKAIDYYQRARNIERDRGNKYYEAVYLTDIGMMYQKQGQLPLARRIFNEALQLNLEIGAKDHQRDTYSILADISAQMGDYSSAFEYLNQYTLITDTLFTETKTKQLAEMQVKYETESKQRENEFLRKEQVLQTTALKRQRLILVVISIGMGIVLVLSFILYRMNVQRLKTNEALQQSNIELTETSKALKEANAAKDRIFSIIAHDLRSPFSIILGFVNVFKRRYDKISKEETFQLIDNLEQNTEATFGLLKNLLEWSRSQLGTLKCEPIRLNLSQVIDDCISASRPNANEKNIAITTQMEPDILATGDKHLTSIVMRNLLSNAIKFTEPGGEVTISIAQINGVAEISVRDTGVGIPEKRLETLFQLEHIVSTRGTADEKGTGLGLVLCREFVEKQGGRISVESKEGKGSCFAFTLPTGNNK